MRAILIDPSTKTITEVEYELKGDDGGYYAMRALVAPPTGLIECVRLSKEVDLFIDEEGLLCNGPHPYGYFKIGTFPQVLAGRGLLVGAPDYEGNCTGLPADLTVAMVTTMTQFIDNPAPEDIEPHFEVRELRMEDLQ